MEKLVGFVGYECEDIVLYLAKILTVLGKKVAVVDRTEQEMLLEVLELKNDMKKELYSDDFYGILVTGQGVSYEEYDIIFYLFGYRLIHPKLYECETLIMVTDGVPAHASLLRKIGNWGKKQYLVIRNLVPMKHTEQYLAILADNENSYCEIPYDESDIRMRYSLSSYSKCTVKQLSAGMKRALMILLKFLSVECPERSIRDAMKRF
ncbi:MAG: hypothetical protein IJ274_05330 [Lachnospiraceae bacterium]|nr:hypothetical protein [Lachnospiraceae bacterium]MBQ8039279.1 hypothetical protein [Lachnospiraceae bacterium]